MEASIFAGIAIVISILVCFVHFKRMKYFTLGFNILIIVVILCLCGSTGTLGGLIAGTIACALVSIFLLISPFKKLDNLFKDN